MPFVKRGKERGGGGVMGCLAEVRGFLTPIFTAEGEKDKTLTPSITGAITLLSEGENQ